MRDLSRRLDDMASTVKHFGARRANAEGDTDDAIDEERMDTIRSLLREASSDISLLEGLLAPMSFSFAKKDGYARVKFEGELDNGSLAELLEFLSQNIYIGE